MKLFIYFPVSYILSGSCSTSLFVGPVELAAVGVAIAVFNQVSKIAIFPLVSVTTSFVAEEDAAAESLIDKSRDIEITERSFDGNDEEEEFVPNLGILLLFFPLNLFSYGSTSHANIYRFLMGMQI